MEYNCTSTGEVFKQPKWIFIKPWVICGWHRDKIVLIGITCTAILEGFRVLYDALECLCECARWP